MNNMELGQGAIFYYQINEEWYGAVRVAAHYPPDSEIAQNHYINDTKESCYLVVETTYLNNAPPQLNDDHLKEMLILTHHSWKNDESYWIVNGPPPSRFHYLGNIESQEVLDIRKMKKMGSWHAFSGVQVLKQHEWDTGNPEEILAREQAEAHAKWEAQKKLETERKNRLGKLTLEEFSRTNPFDKWGALVETKKIKNAANELFRSTVDQVIALGNKRSKRKLMKLLEEMIVGFNTLQAKHKCIETMERDDITKVLGDMFFVFKIKHDPAVYFEKWEHL